MGRNRPLNRIIAENEGILMIRLERSRRMPQKMRSVATFVQSLLKSWRSKSFLMNGRLVKDRYLKLCLQVLRAESWRRTMIIILRLSIRLQISLMILRKSPFVCSKVKTKWNILKSAWQKWTTVYRQLAIYQYKTRTNVTIWSSTFARKKVDSSSQLRKLHILFAWKFSNHKNWNCTSTTKWTSIDLEPTSWWPSWAIWTKIKAKWWERSTSNSQSHSLLVTSTVWNQMVPMMSPSCKRWRWIWRNIKILPLKHMSRALLKMMMTWRHSRSTNTKLAVKVDQAQLISKWRNSIYKFKHQWAMTKEKKM